MSKVFGIGLSRTGTKSLAAALNLLGIRTRYAITETSAVPFCPHFDELYPGSKFILTIRDKQSWLNSCGEHWGDANAPLPLPDTDSLANMALPTEYKYVDYGDPNAIGEKTVDPQL